MDNQSKELPGTLTCQVCWETLTRPVSMCHYEHLLCQDCFQNARKCPSCGCPLLHWMRSLVMEKLTAIERTPCVFREVGCPELLRQDARKRHEETCRYAPEARAARCPLDYSCPWVGSLADVEQHVRHSHKNMLVLVPDGVFTASGSSTTVVQFDSTLFLVRTKSVTGAGNTTHYVHVGHVAQGLRADLAHFCYKVQVEPVGTLYVGPITDYKPTLQQLGAANNCLVHSTEVELHKELPFFVKIKKSLLH